MEKNKIKIYIFKELSNLKFKKETKGFRYLVDAIYLTILDDELIENLTQKLYKKIAKHYEIENSKRIKWCIEETINSMYRNTKQYKINQYFNLENNEKPTPKFVIYTIACKYLNTHI